jgi:hypothetical protein
VPQKEATSEVVEAVSENYPDSTRWETETCKFRFTGRAAGLVVDGLTVEEFEKIVQLLGEVREILKRFEFETLYKKVDEAWRESAKELEKMKKLKREIEPLLKEEGG